VSQFTSTILAPRLVSAALVWRIVTPFITFPQHHTKAFFILCFDPVSMSSQIRFVALYSGGRVPSSLRRNSRCGISKRKQAL
jgi:hypothetical protein